MKIMKLDAKSATQSVGSKSIKKPYSYTNSQKLFQRALKVIPCGIPGHFSPAPLVPPTMYPFYAEKGKGSRFWDIDGNEFIDYMCAYGPMVLGYNHPAVEKAASQQNSKGNCLSAPGKIMVELAEYITHTIAGANWAFFAKNGGDVTNLAVMIARAATGRKKIVMIKGGYHGVSPWMQGYGHYGVIEEDVANVIAIEWNNVKQFEDAIAAHHNDIAGFIATPYHHPTFADSEFPHDGYWQRIRELCTKHGIVLIIDDVRCGFRLDMRGSAAYFGFTPDLACYCKAIANGYPISALVGVEALKTVAAKVFYTGSYWYQSVPMAAALATVKELKRINGPALMNKIGKKLFEGMTKICASYGYNLKVTGAYSMPYVRITNDPSNMLHQEWCAECTARGAYFTSHHNWFVSTAHTQKDIQQTWNIVDDVCKLLKKKYGDAY